MKVGIITFHQAINYGAVLQTYALCKALEKLGVQAEIINYRSQKLESDYKLVQTSDGVRAMLRTLFTAPLFPQKQRTFQSFEKQYLPVSAPAYTTAQLQKLASTYDYVITGSDQVWNWQITQQDMRYLLDFVAPEKRISYAASFGRAELPEALRGQYQELLSNYAALSVREVQGQKILRELLGCEAEVTLDPTLLLKQEDWQNLLQHRDEKKYIVIYNVRMAPKLIDMAKKLQRETGLEIINLNPRARAVYGNRVGYCADPADFVYYLLQAEYVLTTSFHGTIFAINCNKRFLVELDNAKDGGVNSRIESILKILGLEQRVVRDYRLEELYAPIDFTNANARLAVERARSRAFLERALMQHE